MKIRTMAKKTFVLFLSLCIALCAVSLSAYAGVVDYQSTPVYIVISGLNAPAIDDIPDTEVDVVADDEKCSCWANVVWYREGENTPYTSKFVNGEYYYAHIDAFADDKGAGSNIRFKLQDLSVNESSIDFRIDSETSYYVFSFDTISYCADKMAEPNTNPITNPADEPDTESLAQPSQTVTDNVAEPATTITQQAMQMPTESVTVATVMPQQVVVCEVTQTAKKPKSTSILKLTAGKKQFKASWKKVSGVTSYQLQYSTSKSFTKKTTKTVTLKGEKKTSATVKKLKSKKKYYVRVRSCKSGKYSSWSKVKTIKVK